jgi:hypothetical protein
VTQSLRVSAHNALRKGRTFAQTFLIAPTDRLARPTTGQRMERLFDSKFREGLEVLWALIIDSVKNLLNAGLDTKPKVDFKRLLWGGLD